jgi:hypothetical protein
MELIVSIAIIALLIGIATFGIHTLHKSARGTVTQTMVNQIATGIERFEAEAGFSPPLAKDIDPNTGVRRANLNNPNSLIYQHNGQRNAVRVYEANDAQDVTDLNTLNFNAGTIDTNPFEDEFRYSEASLATFLAGAMDVPYSQDAPNSNVPMDGVKGPGLYPPMRHGDFKVPKEVVASDGEKRAGTPWESFINISSGGAKVQYDGDIGPHGVRLVDAGNVPIRYYMWKNGARPAGQPTAPLAVNGLADLRIPRIVGRFTPDTTTPMTDQTRFPTAQDRDIRQNPALRNAKWAVVAAGPNGVFGDEPLADIAKKLGKSADPSEEVKLRSEAEKDNVVRVGDGK